MELTYEQLQAAYESMQQELAQMHATAMAEATNRRELAELLLAYNELPFDSDESDRAFLKLMNLAEGMTK